MKVTIKLMNPNSCGQNSIETYPNIPAFKRFLNHMLYYSSEVILHIPCLNESYKYSETDNIAYLLSQCNHYNETLEVYQLWE